MNIYDTKPLVCAICKISIGEIDWDAQVVKPMCSKCANQLPGDEKNLYTENFYKNNPAKKEIFSTIYH